jgi:hypothetical protein
VQEKIMTHKTLFASLLATSAVCLAISSPASAASTSDRAREAIAAAAAKIHTAETMGAETQAPRETAGARAVLAKAQEDFKTDHREDAIQDAIHASAMADTAIGLTQQHKDAAIAAARDDQRATADSARDQVEAARNQAAQAQDQSVAAQQQAADANARAQSAEQSAAASAADAKAARDAAAIAAQTPPPAPAPVVQTTVTTDHATAVHHAVHHKAAPAKPTTSGATRSTADDTTTTTTTITPQPQQ